MPALKRFKAWVEVDGEPLPEYKIEEDPDGQTVRCWIPSEEGKTFAVHWTNEVGVPLTAGYVSVDGHSMNSKYLNPNGDHTWVETAPMSLSAQAKLRFGRVKLTDDDTLPTEDEQTLKDLGIIKLTIRHGKKGGYVDLVPRIPQKQRAVHEKLKKAAGHRLLLIEDNLLGPPRSRRQAFIRDGSVSIIFIFQYQPRDMLQALEIIPRDAQPDASNVENRQENGLSAKAERSGADSDEDEEDSLDEQDEQEAQRLEARLAGLRKKKRKSSTSHDGKSKRPKIEQIDAAAAFRPGEVIDLT